MDFPNIYQFPPFFTRQVHEETWRKQRDLWIEIILSYCAQHRHFKLMLDHVGTGPMTTETTTNVDVLQPSKLFFNKNINRKLELDMQQEIMDSMVQKGQAERMPGLHGTAGGTGQRGEICLIYWKSPAEWAELLYTWAQQDGLVGTLMTVYEVLKGEGTTRHAFHQMDMDVFDRVVVLLQTQGRVELFHHDEATASPMERGLRFLA